MGSSPSYLLLSPEDWERKIDAAEDLARRCRLCPRACGIDRASGETGFCGAGGVCRVSSAFAHHGEEPPLSGTGGSGTVFFSYCTLRCMFCQNYQLSHQGEGREYTPEEFAGELLRLQNEGCHNVNLVTATHYLPWWLRALREAATRGLELPVVYNCGGYESLQTIGLLNGIVDIYLPDMKYGDNGPAGELSSAPDYVEVNQAAIRAMFRQVGPLKVNRDGIATRGLCIRHLVLPNGLAHSARIVSFLTSTFDPADIAISLMAQYRPLHRASEYPPVNRRLHAAEYQDVRALFERAGFEGFFQDVEELDASFVIDFTTRKRERLTGD
jgi:putative pyruvate formate lyase activating enzyme